MKVLIVTDEEAVRFHLTAILEAERFDVVDAEIGDDLVDTIRLGPWNAVAFDTDSVAPSMLRTLRRAGCRIPVLAMTDEDRSKHRALLLEAGADDALTTPASAEEITARLRALIRRASGHAENVVTAGPVSVDLGRQIVRVDGEPVYLTRNEWRVMELLALRKGLEVSKDSVMNHLYSGMDEPEQKIVDIFICKIRRKLGVAKDAVQTVWGRGYRLAVGDALPEKPVKVPTGPPPRVMHRIMKVLSDGAADLDSIGHQTGLHRSQTQSVIGRARSNGLVESRRFRASGRQGWGPATYSITDAGQAWLDLHGNIA